MLEVCGGRALAASLLSGFVGFSVACSSEFLYRKGSIFFENARRATAVQRPTKLKKKIRAIQYGVGPIGASIVRLMREKFAIEIIGAIDTDPAKVGRDLGEVVGAIDAPWGVKI